MNGSGPELGLLERQVDEIEALLATFPEEGGVQFSPAELATLELAREMVAGGGDTPRTAVGLLSGAVCVPDVIIGGAPVLLRYTLVERYPDTLPRLTIECSSSRHVHDELSDCLQQYLAEVEGSECLLLAVSYLQDKVQELLDSERTRSAASRADEHQASRLREQEMGVRVIWFHHIKSPTKRSHIVNWARELGLRGFSKPGYPGIVICEGSEEDVVEYVSRLRHLKWKAMQVRAETTTPLATPNDGEQPSDIWHFNDREFLELGENGLSELATLCRGAGLEEMFLSALKISR